MKLLTFKTLWGHTGDFASACEQASLAHFDGIEGPAPQSVDEQKQWLALLQAKGLGFIGEICTAGGYVPDRNASLTDHLQSLEHGLQACSALGAMFVTCLGGCDAWEEETSLAFFEQAMSMAGRYGMVISFETHRGRSLFNPWVTRRLCQQLPQIRLTCDFSHWCVVCERLMDSEAETLEALLPHAFHIHARVGYDQGPQVVDPRAPRYAQAVASHWYWWERIWACAQQDGRTAQTLTPEFGPDGYQALDIETDAPVGDLWEINQWMAQQARERFAASNYLSGGH